MNYTNIGLVEHVKKCLGMPNIYMWGTMMNLITEDLINRKAKQYPSKYTDERKAILKEKINNAYGCDCVGLIKSYYWGGIDSPKYNSKNDYNTSSMYKAASIKGALSGIPEVPGVCVYQEGHVGVYIGNGEVIECTKSAYGDGIIKTSLNNRGWTNYFYCSEIEYIENTPEETNPDSETSATEINLNDIVWFKGGAHYVSSDATTAAGTPSAGWAKVTNRALKNAHPYHLIHTDSASNVYGWVDADTISKDGAGEASGDSETYFEYTVKTGDNYWSIAEKFLGDGNRYKEILELNNRSESDLIYNGTVLKIPKE